MAGLKESVFLYVGDIIVFGCSLKHHNSNLITVFERYRKYNLKLNSTKSNFLQREVNYLGHLISDKGRIPDQKKI